jgi:hypothetical protein
VVARPRPDLLLVRHEAIDALGMGAMELMGVRAEPALLDPLGLAPGEAVRLAVRPEGDTLVLVWIERR